MNEPRPLSLAALYRLAPTAVARREPHPQARRLAVGEARRTMALEELRVTNKI